MDRKISSLAARCITVCLMWLSHCSLASPLSFIEYYDYLLKYHVITSIYNGNEQTFVDYDAWQADPDHKNAMLLLTHAEPETLTEQDKLVFWINAYNLLTIDFINQNNERRSILNLGGLFTLPWKRADWKIGDRKYTLHEIEHEILRKMNEPRIHFAIVCASRSCPNLRPEAYRVGKLEQQLTEQTQKFLANSQKGMQVLPDGVLISKIFDWFDDDFGPNGDVLTFIQANTKHALPNTIAGYLEYDWDLNIKQ